MDNQDHVAAAGRTTSTTRGSAPPVCEGTTTPSGWRTALRDRALQVALQKRTAGVPTYSVPEAAALLSISQEYLYRLIQADGFPAIRMRLSRSQGRYVVPAIAVEKLLNHASFSGACIEAADWATQWQAEQQVAGSQRASQAPGGSPR